MIFESISLSTASKILWIFFTTASSIKKLSTLMNNINEIDTTILNKSKSVVTCILLYGGESLKDEVNLLILNATIDFVLSASRFDEPFYLLWIHGCFSFYSWLYSYNFTILKISIFPFSFYIFISLSPIIVMVPGDCFYILCVYIHFHRKKKSHMLQKNDVRLDNIQKSSVLYVRFT